MAQQIINNGESGAVVRTKLNDNFTELYGSATNPYPRVTDYASLPAASSFTAKIYVVETSTGIWPLRKPAGLWLSNGTAWNWLGNTTLVASEIINTPAGTIAATDIQGAINELDGDVQTLVTNQYTDEKARDAIGAALVAGSNITITVNDPADTITISSTGGGGGGLTIGSSIPVVLGRVSL